jgi:hypothetical protein
VQRQVTHPRATGMPTGLERQFDERGARSLASDAAVDPDERRHAAWQFAKLGGQFRIQASGV